MTYIYDRYDYASARLANTVIMKKGVPVYIHGIRANLQAEYQEVGSSEIKEVALTKENGFDLKVPTLGYVNVAIDGLRSLFLQRLPERRWKQGLSHSNVGHGWPWRRVGRVILVSRAFRDSLLNIYPSKEEALALISDQGVADMAFSKNFSLSKRELGNVMLCYKGLDVGFADDLQFKLGKGFEYLRESLEEL